MRACMLILLLKRGSLVLFCHPGILSILEEPGQSPAPGSGEWLNGWDLPLPHAVEVFPARSPRKDSAHLSVTFVNLLCCSCSQARNGDVSLIPRQMLFPTLLPAEPRRSSESISSMALDSRIQQTEVCTIWGLCDIPQNRHCISPACGPLNIHSVAEWITDGFLSFGMGFLNTS